MDKDTPLLVVSQTASSLWVLINITKEVKLDVVKLASPSSHICRSLCGYFCHNTLCPVS